MQKGYSQYVQSFNNSNNCYILKEEHHLSVNKLLLILFIQLINLFISSVHILAFCFQFVFLDMNKLLIYYTIRYYVICYTTLLHLSIV